MRWPGLKKVKDRKRTIIVVVILLSIIFIIVIKFLWLTHLISSSRRHDLMDLGDMVDHECTPQTALKIQFLRLVHSFCDRHE